MPDQATERAREVAQDRVTLLRSTAIVAFGYGLGAALQSTFVFANYVTTWQDVSLWSRLGANAVGVVLVVLALWVLGTHRRRNPVAITCCLVVAAAVCAAGRYAAQVVLGVHVDASDVERTTELVAGAIIALISSGIGVWAMLSRRRMRTRVRRAERESVHVELAVQALEDEEIRVRRAVAEGLHGTLQGKLVLLDAQLDEVVRHVALDPRRAADTAALRRVQAELAVVRELDVRQMSRLLYPDRLELGLVPAVRALLSRVPATIATRLVASDAVRAVDDPELGSLTVAQRLLAVRVVEEGITNALKYGPPTTIMIDLDARDGLLVVGVENDGPTYDPADGDAEGGTARLTERVDLVHGAVTLRARHPQGARLEARLPM